MAITDAWLKAHRNKEHKSIIEKSDGHGLSARVTKRGKIVFQLRYRYDGKQHRVDLGSYPSISLRKAREESLRFKSELELGHDPRVIKKTEILTNVKTLALDELFYKWYESYCVNNKKTPDDIKRTFQIHVFPKFGGLPPDRITANLWMTLLESIKKDTPSIASRILVNSKQMLSWGVRRQLVTQNCLSDINSRLDLSITHKVGSRVLNDEEIKMILIAIRGSRMATKNKLFLKLCLIYGCRKGELRLSKKADYDFNSLVWTIPPENHKAGKITGKPLLRPITKKVLPLLERCMLLNNTELMFTHANTDKPLGPSASGNLPYIIMQWLKTHKNYSMEHWHIHVLRKTARTNFSTLTQPHIAEIMLGHKLPGQWGVYDLHSYLEEQAECIDKWIDRLESITGFPLL